MLDSITLAPLPGCPGGQVLDINRPDSELVADLLFVDGFLVGAVVWRNGAQAPALVPKTWPVVSDLLYTICGRSWSRLARIKRAFFAHRAGLAWDLCAATVSEEDSTLAAMLTGKMPDFVLAI